MKKVSYAFESDDLDLDEEPADENLLASEIETLKNQISMKKISKKSLT